MLKLTTVLLCLTLLSGCVPKKLHLNLEFNKAPDFPEASPEVIFNLMQACNKKDCRDINAYIQEVLVFKTKYTIYKNGDKNENST